MFILKSQGIKREKDTLLNIRCWQTLGIFSAGPPPNLLISMGSGEARRGRDLEFFSFFHWLLLLFTSKRHSTHLITFSISHAPSCCWGLPASFLVGRQVGRKVYILLPGAPEAAGGFQLCYPWNAEHVQKGPSCGPPPCDRPLGWSLAPHGRGCHTRRP